MNFPYRANIDRLAAFPTTIPTHHAAYNQMLKPPCRSAPLPSLSFVQTINAPVALLTQLRALSLGRS